jgi:hypothetical protein
MQTLKSIIKNSEVLQVHQHNGLTLIYRMLFAVSENINHVVKNKHNPIFTILWDDCCLVTTIKHIISLPLQT